MHSPLSHSLLLLGAFGVASASAGELRIGAASTDITPDRPVALDGQFKTRISSGVDNPITATAVAIESRATGRMVDQVVFVSVDMLWIQSSVLDPLRKRLGVSLPDLDVRKLVVTATHTHTAPVVQEGWYRIPPEGVMPPGEYRKFLLGRLEEVVTRAWNARKPGGVSWGLGAAVVGHNRRAVYADASAKMYGPTDVPEFRRFESGADPFLDTLFFWNERKELLAAGINVACPSQVVEHRSTIGADFWHDVREHVRAGLGKDLCILGWPGASGDLSPRRLYGKAAEERMLERRGLTLTQEIGRRIGREVVDVCELVRNDIRTSVPFGHTVETLTLPVRKVTDEEAANAAKEIEALQQKGDKNLKIGWFKATLQRHRDQAAHPTFDVDVHVVRIGDTAVATSPFELFQDYATQIKARSRAEQTLVLELTDGWGQYLPTAHAVTAGGYSAIIQSNKGGPEAGQILVDHTVRMINDLWPATNAPVSQGSQPQGSP